MKEKTKRQIQFIFLLAAIFLLALILKNFFLVQQAPETANTFYDKTTNTVYLNNMSLEQKIGQTIVSHGDEFYLQQITDANIGTIFLVALKSPEDYTKLIGKFQNKSSLPLFVVADVEGCINAFELFAKFPAFKDINTTDEAYKAGEDEGKMMKVLGFNMDFSPVVDLEDNFWKCRSFTGNATEISEKAKAYIQGLQSQGIIAVAKHYPGKTLSVKDPHKKLVEVTIEPQDLEPFDASIEAGVKAIMASHAIANGTVDSEGKPAVASSKLVGDLRKKFSGLIITDDTRMAGLREFYNNSDDMYFDLVNAGNDLILVLGPDPTDKTHFSYVQNAISSIARGVASGKIPESKINEAVTRILKAKGIDVIASS